MKKRLLSLLILLFMVISLITPFLGNSNEEVSHQVTESILVSNITYKAEQKITLSEIDLYELAIQKMEEKMSEIDSIEDNKEWFVAYKSIISEYSKWIDPPETIYDYFTEYEIDLICRVVETETYQCDFDSKVNVANVLLNRLESGDFGKTIHEIVTSKNQFAYGRQHITEDTLLAVEYAFQIGDTTNGALFFHSNAPTDTFCGREYIFSDDAIHHFY